MLAVFDRTVAEAPEGLKSPEGAASGAVAGVGPIMKHFAGVREGAVIVSLGSPGGAIGYDANHQNPLLPRLFGAVNDIFCVFEGQLENMAQLKQEYGLSKMADEVAVLIEAYKTLRDRGPYPPSKVIRDLNGKFAFVLFDSTQSSTFIATDAYGGVPFFWGTDSEDRMILSDDVEMVKKACGKSFAPFPKGCFFTTKLGLNSFEHPNNELKAMPRVDSQGQVCGATFKVDNENKKELKKEKSGIPRNDSAADWSNHY
ncbi:hypothetical protein LUZ60_006680 [Juncus effusus]|nr:hypothetical protein LUZ60_006680 [Juncus effusus]